MDKVGGDRFNPFRYPMHSFSRARRDDGGPPPVRDDDSLRGLLKHSGYELELVETGNQVMEIIVELAMLCYEVGTLWSIENPASSMLRLMPEMLRPQRSAGLHRGLF